jgi:hypothetical protein
VRVGPGKARCNWYAGHLPFALLGLLQSHPHYFIKRVRSWVRMITEPVQPDYASQSRAITPAHSRLNAMIGVLEKLRGVFTNFASVILGRSRWVFNANAGFAVRLPFFTVCSISPALRLKLEWRGNSPYFF